MRVVAALLQRKTLIGTKNRTEDVAFALFFCPHPGGFDSSRVLTPGNLPSKAKKMQMPGVSLGGRGLGAAGID